VNCLGALLGDGWFRGNYDLDNRRNFVWHAAGIAGPARDYLQRRKKQIVSTDENWKATTGPILLSDIYDGETYDARMERAGWSAPGYDDRIGRA